MIERPLDILQVSTADSCGGAERVARLLFEGLRSQGLGSWMAVGQKRSKDPDVLPIPNTRLPGGWEQFFLLAEDCITGCSIPARVIRAGLRAVAAPGRFQRAYQGLEDFEFPGTRRLLELPPRRPDIVHAHNLHGGYFDLREIPAVSSQVPFVLTLHDGWLLSGHCAHSFGCDRWKTGCGYCPDLTIFPSIPRDATARNWRRKEKIFRRSRIYVATPSRWLMQRVEQSLIARSIVEARVIPNGVNLAVYRPANKGNARRRLGLDENARILLFAARGTRSNPFRSFETLVEAVRKLTPLAGKGRLLLLALGEDGPRQRIGDAELFHIPFQTVEEMTAAYYQAADVYIHAAKADTFPNVVIEALACGTPVVATAVGGIPEQIHSLDVPGCAPVQATWAVHGASVATGVLTPAADAEGLSRAISLLLWNDELRSQLGRNAAADARKRFDLNRQLQDYLEWYREITR